MSKSRPLKVIAGAPDHPLRIGEIEIPCYVLEDETRVLSQRGVYRSLGRAGSLRKSDGDKLPPFLAQKNIKPLINKGLLMVTTPVLFKSPRAGKVAYGYRAELLPQVCEVYLKARDAKVLLPSQKHIAGRCEVLLRGFAHVGIIALVDEATGYQAIRDRQTLDAILDKHLRSYQARWAKRFPDEFYKEIFRLKGWPWPGMQINRPQIVGHYTNDIVYARIAHGLLNKLQQLNPVIGNGDSEHKHHQWLTDDFGQPELYTHLVGVMAIMKTVTNNNSNLAWGEFKRRLQRAYPKKNTNFDLDFDE